MPRDPRALKLYIDGSALKNPGGAGAYAVWAVYPDDWARAPLLIAEVGFHETTNNRMELLACICALEHVRDGGTGLGVERVLIVTDSQYVCDGQRSVQFWRRNQWRTASGKPIENPDLWKRFVSVRSAIRLRVDIVREKGKTSPILKEVDKSAKRAAKQPWETDRGFRPGKVGRSNLKGASTPYPADGGVALIREYRSRLLKQGEQKIYFEVISGEVFTAKHHAFASSPLADELHRGNVYRVRFNANPQYPMILEILEP